MSLKKKKKSDVLVDNNIQLYDIIRKVLSYNYLLKKILIDHTYTFFGIFKLVYTILIIHVYI